MQFKRKKVFLFLFFLIACQVIGRGAEKSAFMHKPENFRWKNNLFYHCRKNPSSIINSQTIPTLFPHDIWDCCTSWTNSCYTATSINPEWKNCPNCWWMALSGFPIELCCETMMHIGKSPCVPFSSYAYPILDSFHSLWHPLQTNVSMHQRWKWKCIC